MENGELIIAAFLLGIAIENAGYRLQIARKLKHNPYTLCDYCRNRPRGKYIPRRQFPVEVGKGAQGKGVTK